MLITILAILCQSFLLHTYIMLSVDRIITHETVISLMITTYLHQGSQLKEFVMFSEIFLSGIFQSRYVFDTYKVFFMFFLHSLPDQHIDKMFRSMQFQLELLAKNQWQHPNQFGGEEKTRGIKVSLLRIITYSKISENMKK